MKILAIETSCDDTGISILQVTHKKDNKKNNEKNKGLNTVAGTSFEVLANELSSQTAIHSPYGGVYPMIAKREHEKNLPILLEKVLKKAKLKNKEKDIDLVIVTSGPGLEIALWAGITFAKEFGAKYGIPVLPANHMEGHIFSVFAKDKGEFTIPPLSFPLLSLLVSGGHTELVVMKDWMKYKVIGQTLDDASGEAFDKVARMLDLPYPGGPEISKLAEGWRKFRRSVDLRSLGRSGDDGQRKFSAENFRAEKINTSPKFQSSKHSDLISVTLPRPMIYSKNFDFSFSGLKTAVLYLIRDLKKQNPDILQNDKMKSQIACEFEDAVVETLVYKTKKALEKYKVETLLVAGGVSANKHLQKELQKLTKSLNLKNTLLLPETKLTGDNSIMIGVAGYFKYIKNKHKIPKHKNIKAEGNLKLK